MPRRTLDEMDPRRGREGRTWRNLSRELLTPGVHCWLCGKPIAFGLRRNHPMGPSLDHIIPISRGGHPTDRSNLAPAHYGCNAARGDGTKPVRKYQFIQPAKVKVQSREW